VVLDFDDADLFHEVLGLSPRSLAAHTPVVRTSRGYHAYARCSGIRTRVPRNGLSVLGEGSLAVAPPSVHPSGISYSFVAEPRRIAALAEFAPQFCDEGFASHEPTDRVEESNEIAAVEPLSREDAFHVIRGQHPRVVEAWSLLTTRPPSGRVFEGSGSDAWSRADFLVALCLIQHGADPERVAAFLTTLEGSKAAERGLRYARRTCERAAETAWTGRLPGRAGASKPS
jgi:hypothetical protein